MDYLDIQLKVLEVYQTCEIQSFPFDCISLIKSYGLMLHQYDELDELKRFQCFRISDDAFSLQNSIYYNTNRPPGRIRFSLMHELGHYMLDHNKHRKVQEEREANYFARTILAPHVAVYYAGCKNQQDVADLFSLTNECSQYVFNSYRKWRRFIVHHQPNQFDRDAYSHFYHESEGRFVYKIDFCQGCGKELHNYKKPLCFSCQAKQLRIQKESVEIEQDVIRMRDQWLYNN